MSAFLDRLAATAPLFVLIFVGYAITRWGRWPKVVGDALTRFVFGLALPAFLFSTLSDFSHLPPVDLRLLIAFFGGALLVFLLGRVLVARLLRLDGVSASVFALGGIFSNNVILGLPLARVTLGDVAIPSVALVLIFNSLILWTLVTVSVEWARHGELSAKGFVKTAQGVLANPLIIAIFAGTAWGLTGWRLPALVTAPLAMLANVATPTALIALGMGLAEYDLRKGIGASLAVCAMKLLVCPLVVWLLASLLHLPKLETEVVVLLASMSMGVNVYLMSRQFQAFEAPTATGMVLSTALAVVTTPIILAWMG